VKFLHNEKEVDFWSKSDFGNKSPFEKFRGKSLDELSKEEQEFLLEGTGFSEGFNASRVKFLFPMTSVSVEPHSIRKWLGLSHNLFFKIDEYGVIAEKAVIEVYNNKGKLHSRIISNENGASGPLITENGKYLLNQYGRDDGESGYFKAGIKIYELPEGKLIYTLETDDLNLGNDAFSIRNVFIKRMARGNQYENLIFDPEKELIYQKTISFARIGEIMKFEETGYLLKDGSLIKYEDEFDVIKMAQ